MKISFLFYSVDLSFQRGVTNQRTIASSLKLKLSPLMTLNDLKKKLFKEQNIPLQSQNFWLNGKLITDGDATLELISRGSFEVHIFVSATISGEIFFRKPFSLLLIRYLLILLRDNLKIVQKSNCRIKIFIRLCPKNLSLVTCEILKEKQILHFNLYNNFTFI